MKEVTILEFENHIGKKYKVTRNIPGLKISETKIFKDKNEALRQFNDWIQ